MLSFALLLLAVGILDPSNGSSWNDPTSSQYHIQTDEGNERYFRYQTISGQYRKEKRLEDGTVVGTYAWIDDNGFLHQRDYIADNGGYRILKSKNVFVGRNTPIAQAIKAAKKVGANAGTLVKTGKPTPRVEISSNSVYSTTHNPTDLGYGSTISTTPTIIEKSTPIVINSHDIANPLSLTTLQPPPASSFASRNSWLYSSEPQYDHRRKSDVSHTFQNGPTYPIDTHGQVYTGNHNNLGNGYDPQYPYYDGISVTNDGFRYYIPRAYHEEQTLQKNTKTGSFGYIDPFGIRRVIYYNAAPGSGFQHRKNNRYVGFDATPYDPRPYK